VQNILARSPFTPTLVIAVTIAILFGACTSDEESSDTSQTEQSAAISAADLSNLVLDVNEVSVDGTTLPLDPEDTGQQSWSDQVDGPDSEWIAVMLEKYQWQAGYYQDFGTGGQDSPVFNASVALDLYNTRENAIGALGEQLDHVLSQEGQTSEDVTLESVEIFEVSDFGATGMKWTVRRSDGMALYLTNIDFVRGPLVVDVGTGSFDERDLLPATIDLVRLVDAHLAAAGLT